MMNTTHIFNKARLNAMRRQDVTSIDGLDIDELLTALHREIANVRLPTIPNDLGKQGWALVIGIEVGKLLCDPATHLAGN